jgi:ELWxxDGT repeat protein
MATRIVFLSLKFDPTNSIDLELGFSDGNPGGALIFDLYPGLDGSSHFNMGWPHFFTQLGDKIIFEATNAANGRELWITDGTAGGTQLLADINTVAPTATHSSFFPANNFNGQIQIDFAKPVVFNGNAYFAADDGVHGLELWRTDGTSGGTELFADINLTGTSASSPQYLVTFNNELYFVADDGTNHRQIWKTDGTSGNAVQVTNIPLGAGGDPTSAGPFSLTVSGNQLYFIFYDGTADPVSGHQQQIYVTDGTVGGEHLLSPSHPAILDPRSLTDINGTLYFTMHDGTHGYELWKSDGTDAGTQMINDIYDDGTFGSNAPSSVPFGYTFHNGEVYFAVQDDGLHGAEIWKTDGTAAGTMMIKNINTTLTGSGPHDDGSIFVPFEHFTIFNNELYFTATDGAANHGQELWKTNGTAAGTVLVADLIPGNMGGAPAALQVIDGALYFGAVSAGSVTARLMKYDGVNPPVAISDNYHYGAGFEYFSFIQGPSNTPPAQAANTGTTLNEGASTTILNAQLDFDDAQESDSQITYTVTALTANGTLFRSGIALALNDTFTQADIVGNLVSYTHNGSETTSDQFGFSLSDGVNPAATDQTFAITVIPQNDAPVLNANTGATVDEGASTMVLNAQLDFNDPDNTDSQITYTLTSLTANGTLFRGGIALALNDTFTQADIVGNLLSYTHDGSETTSDQLGFSVSDGIAPAVTGQTFAFTVIPVNDPPVIVSGGGGASASYFVRVNEKAITTVISADADVGDINTFSIVGGADASRFSIDPSTGELVFKAHPNPPNKSYTVQVQVSDGHGGVDQQAITVNVSANKMNGDVAHSIDETFVFHPKFGANTVTHFDLDNDFLQFDSGMFATDTAAAVLAAAHDENGGLGIDVHAGHLKIAGITKADLAAHLDAILFV